MAISVSSRTSDDKDQNQLKLYSQQPGVKSVPEPLRRLHQWVGWRFENRQSKNGLRRVKVPVSANTGRNAKVNDSSTWTSFQQALVRYESRESHLDGIGFVFSPDDLFVGIDLDDCLDEHRSLSNLAQQVITEVSSYAEVSPSCRGVKIIAKSTLPIVSRRDSTRGIEVYSSHRFFTITGNVLGCHHEIADCTERLSDLLHELFPERSRNYDAPVANVDLPNVSPDHVLYRARKAKNGMKFQNLLIARDAPGSGSASEGDLALCCLLAFWAGPHPVLVDEIFRLSKRYRPKWDERHFANGASYGEETIRRAIILQNGRWFRWPSQYYSHQ